MACFAFAWAPKPFLSFGLGTTQSCGCGLHPLVSESQSCPNLSGSMVPICLQCLLFQWFNRGHANIWVKLQKLERSSMVFPLRDFSAAWRRMNRTHQSLNLKCYYLDVRDFKPKKSSVEWKPLRSPLWDPWAPSSRAPGMGGKLMDGPPGWRQFAMEKLGWNNMAIAVDDLRGENMANFEVDDLACFLVIDGDFWWFLVRFSVAMSNYQRVMWMRTTRFSES